MIKRLEILRSYIDNGLEVWRSKPIYRTAFNKSWKF